MAFAVVTRVKVRPGSIDGLAALFDSTNRELVAGHDGWLGAWFTANRADNEVTVIAKWRDAGSYEELRNSTEFQSMMPAAMGTSTATNLPLRGKAANPRRANSI